MAKIAIFGAGRVGMALLRALESQRHSITIVEEDAEVCEEIAAESKAMAINGDATDPKLLDELKVGEMDYAFAVTGNEETNFLAAVYAKQSGAKKVISRVSEAKHSLLLQRLGVEPAISQLTLARELANRVSSPTIFKLLNASESNVELVEKRVDSGMNGKTVQQVDRNPKSNVVATFQDGRFRVARHDDVLKEGMRIIMVREKD